MYLLYFLIFILFKLINSLVTNTIIYLIIFFFNYCDVLLLKRSAGRLYLLLNFVYFFNIYFFIKNSK